MYGAYGQRGRYRQPSTRDVAVGEHDNGSTAPDRIDAGLYQAYERLLEILGFSLVIEAVSDVAIVPLVQAQ